MNLKFKDMLMQRAKRMSPKDNTNIPRSIAAADKPMKNSKTFLWFGLITVIILVFGSYVLPHQCSS
jgi:hypothetical protein